MYPCSWRPRLPPQRIDFGRLQHAFQASVSPTEAAEPLPPPRPVRAVTALPDLGAAERERLRRLGYQLIAQVPLYTLLCCDRQSIDIGRCPSVINALSMSGSIKATCF